MFILQSGSWIITALIVCLALFIFSLAGKISPKFSLLLMALGVGTTYMISSVAGAPDANDQFTDTSAASTADSGAVARPTGAPEKEAGKTEQDRSGSRSSPSQTKGMQDPEAQLPESYEAIDPQFRTYRAEGNWQWSASFIAALEQETAWKNSKKGNFAISVDYLGSFTQEMDQQSRVFVYSGGEIEIKVNGSPCCCNGSIVIPEKLSAAGMNEIQELLQETITRLIAEQQPQIIEKIKKCL